MRGFDTLLVCTECASSNVEVRAWIDANTNEYVDDDSRDMAWCNECEQDTTLREETDEEKQMHARQQARKGETMTKNGEPPQNATEPDGRIRPMTHMESTIWTALYGHGLKDALAAIKAAPGEHPASYGAVQDLLRAHEANTTD